ncbi:MAG: arsenic transporter [Treponema sp.]|nr:MAG: arsenic transporter [Treponema sp.]
MSPLIIAAVIFAVTYLLLILLTNHRPIVAVSSAIVFVVLGMLGIFDYGVLKALGAIDWNVILMISGTMGLVALFIESKMPQLIADKIINSMPDIKWTVVMLSLFAGFVSAFIDNVATVLMIIPVALVLTDRLKISPVLPVIAIAISANLQGAATLVGDTVSILLGSQLDLTFFDFLWYMGRPCLFFIVQIAAVLTTVYIYFVFKGHSEKPAKMEETVVKDFIPSILLLVMIVLLILASFIPQDKKPEITNGLICMALLLIGLVYSMAYKKSLVPFKTVWKGMEFDTIALLIGLFIVIGGVDEAGVIKAIGGFFSNLDIGIFGMYTILVWLSVFISAFVDNIPYVATMLPIVQILSDGYGLNSPILFFGLLMGATLGGNITPVGASANIASINILRSNGHKVSNGTFMKMSVPFTLIAVVTGYVLTWLIYGLGMGIGFTN